MVYTEFLGINEKLGKTFIQQNPNYKKNNYVQKGVALTIQEVSLSDNTCTAILNTVEGIEIIPFNLDDLFWYILTEEWYVTNPMKLEKWKGFSASQKIKEKWNDWDNGTIDSATIYCRQDNLWYLEIKGYRPNPEVHRFLRYRSIRIPAMGIKNISEMKEFCKKYVDIKRCVKDEKMVENTYSIWRIRF